MSILSWPSNLVNVVGTLPVAATWSEKLPACGLLSMAVTWTFAASGRLNCAVKYGRLRGDLGRRHRGGVARQHQPGRVERCLHRGARRVAAAVVDRRADESDDRNKPEREHRRDAAAPVRRKRDHIACLSPLPQ